MSVRAPLAVMLAMVLCLFSGCSLRRTVFDEIEQMPDFKSGIISIDLSVNSDTVTGSLKLDTDLVAYNAFDSKIVGSLSFTNAENDEKTTVPLNLNVLYSNQVLYANAIGLEDLSASLSCANSIKATAEYFSFSDDYLHESGISVTPSELAARDQKVLNSILSDLYSEIKRYFNSSGTSYLSWRNQKPALILDSDTIEDFYMNASTFISESLVDWKESAVLQLQDSEYDSSKIIARAIDGIDAETLMSDLNRLRSLVLDDGYSICIVVSSAEDRIFYSITGTAAVNNFELRVVFKNSTPTVRLPDSVQAIG